MVNSIIRREPFQEMVSLRDAMNRLFEDSWIRPESASPAPTFESPVIDMYQTKDEVVVKATVPGLKAEDIDISVSGNVLTIKGETKHEEKIEQEQYVYQERRFGQFCRQVTLPVQVKADKAQAQCEHGVLTLKLPKAEEAKPKSLKIKIK